MKNCKFCLQTVYVNSSLSFLVFFYIIGRISQQVFIPDRGISGKKDVSGVQGKRYIRIRGEKIIDQNPY